MVNKRLLAILVLGLLLANFLALTINAQEAPPGLPKELENPEETLEQIKNKTETKWDYLGKEWKNILLKNNVVKAVDAFLTKISFLFLILFGMPYSLSLTLLIIIILWIYFLFEFSSIMKTFSSFSEYVSYIISIGLVIILAQLQILKKITEILGWFVFAKKGIWWNIIMTIVLILVFVVIAVAAKLIEQAVKERKEKELKEQAEQEQKRIIKVGKALGQI